MLRNLMLLTTVAALLAVPAQATDPVPPTTADVTLDVTILGQDHATCTVTVDHLGNGADVLNAALDAGCLDNWASDDFGSPGAPNRFVTVIDDVEQAALGFATSWAMYLNGEMTAYGIDEYGAIDGDVLAFDYDAAFAQYVIACTLEQGNPLC